MLTKTCAQCGATFQTYHKPQRYCCITCARRHRTEASRVAKVCPHCHREFVVRSGHSHRKYCSKSCAVSDRKRPNWHRYTERVCPNCRKPFSRIAWSPVRFCCYRCSQDFRVGKPRGTKLAPMKAKKWGPQRVQRNHVKSFVHRDIMEAHLGRKLVGHERVHHIDCNPFNNTLSNLYLCKDEREHQKAHRGIERLVAELLNRGVLVFENGVYNLAVAVTWQEMEAQKR
jgi:hypothetical protein